MKSLRIALAAVGLLLAAPSAYAQTVVVQSCGTLAAPYTVGNTGRPIVMDVNGNTCGSISQGGNTVGVSIDGNLLVNTPPASQFFDAFSSSLDTTTNWTANNSTGTAATSAGSLVISSSTTASAWGGLSSKQSWAPQGVSLQVYGVWATFTTKTIANSARVWGMFSVPGSPTTAVPATDGYVWRLDGTGSLFAEIWASGVAISSTNITTLCPITNSVPNTYAIYYRTGLTQFYCGATLAATIGGFAPANQTLPVSAFSIAGSTPPLSSATMTLGGLTLATYSQAIASKAAGQAATTNDPSGVIQISPNSAGLITLGQTTKSASVPVTIASDQYVDPCQSPNIAKSSAAINVTSATTTSLVAVSGTTTVYVCGFSITIAPSAVTADTVLFEYGTGASCTSPTALTGTFGNGDLTSTVGVAPISYGGGGATIFKSAASAGVCILTAGNAVNVQGVLTYVQQ